MGKKGGKRGTPYQFSTHSGYAESLWKSQPHHALIEPEKGVADKTGIAGFQPCLADGLQVV
jgi:hypothetical protein